MTCSPYRVCDRNGGRRLRQWLIEQIDSGMYPGLIWENEEKTMFRIPWKHAGKQDYNQEVDASIFKAWAIFKGKYKDGDKAEPATWKTRLRCALNKSPDFEEVTERSQLDISEPYKVYRIVPEEEQKCKLGMGTKCSLNEITDMDCNPSSIEELMKETPSAVEEYLGTIKRTLSLMTGFAAYEPLLEEHLGPPLAVLKTGYLQTHLMISTLCDFVAYSQMVINFYYGGKLVGSTTTSRPEGCRISLGEAPYCLDSLEHVQFPSAELISNERQRQITRKLFGHLERGVLLHCNKQGIFIKRLSQGRVFWSGNTMACKEKPNKLDRDEKCACFPLPELHQYYNNQGRFPNSKVILCFGEEFPDAVPLRCKLILVEIEQLSIRQLVEEARKNETNAVGHSAGEEAHYDQMYRNYQDSCGPHQRPIFRENQQITV
ncbi:hypothetical protein Chor_004901 [Crotalus horridus]